MSKVTLYYTQLSPPSRTILTVAEAIGLDLEKKNIDLFKFEHSQYSVEHITPEFGKINPQHTVPVIVDNGVTIYDSHAVAGYLCDIYAKDDKLYPKDTVQRAHINARLHFDAGYLYAAMDCLWIEIFDYGANEVPPKVIKNIKKCWDNMERFLENRKFLCGDNLSIADISCIATLSSMDSFLPIDKEKYPRLVKWIQTMEEFPFYEVNRQGAELVHELMWNIIKENQSKAKL